MHNEGKTGPGESAEQSAEAAFITAEQSGWREHLQICQKVQTVLSPWLCFHDTLGFRG